MRGGGSCVRSLSCVVAIALWVPWVGAGRCRDRGNGRAGTAGLVTQSDTVGTDPAFLFPPAERSRP